MKNLLIVVSFLFVSLSYGQFIEKSNVYATLSAGLLNNDFHAMAEYSISNKITAGAFYSLHKKSITHQKLNQVLGTEKYSANSYGVRISAHFINTDKFNLFVGADLGMEKVKYTGTDQKVIVKYKGQEFIYGGHLGFRYLFSESFGALVEAAYMDDPIIKVGLSYRF